VIGDVGEVETGDVVPCSVVKDLRNHDARG
jgi:hypothetical protein